MRFQFQQNLNHLAQTLTELVKPDVVIVFGGDVKPGNSGGPLLNDQGQVLGVVFAADEQNKKQVTH